MEGSSLQNLIDTFNYFSYLLLLFIRSILLIIINYFKCISSLDQLFSFFILVIITIDVYITYHYIISSSFVVFKTYSRSFYPSFFLRWIHLIIICFAFFAFIRLIHLIIFCSYFSLTLNLYRTRWYIIPTLFYLSMILLVS